MGAIASQVYKGWKIQIRPSFIKGKGFFSSLKPPGCNFFVGYSNCYLPTVAEAIADARGWIDRGSWQVYRGFFLRAFPCPQGEGWCWELMNLDCQENPAVWSWERLTEKTTYRNHSQALMKARRKINQLNTAQIVAPILDQLVDLRPEVLDWADCDRLITSIMSHLF